MRLVVGRFRQPFRPASPINALHEDRLIAAAIGLKRHSRAVRRPDGRAVSALQRESLQRACSAERVDRDGGLVPSVTFNRKARAVSGNPGAHIRACGNRKTRHAARAVRQPHHALAGCGAGRARNVKQVAGVRHRELRRAGCAARHPSDALDDGSGLSRDLLCRGVEGHGEHDAAARIQEMAARHVLGGAAALEQRGSFAGLQGLDDDSRVIPPRRPIGGLRDGEEQAVPAR